MTLAKCLIIPVLLIFIGVMWYLYRKKTNQVLILVAAATLVGGALRLFQVQDEGETLTTVTVAVVGLFVVWGITWASNRYMSRRRTKDES